MFFLLLEKNEKGLAEWKLPREGSPSRMTALHRRCAGAPASSASPPAPPQLLRRHLLKVLINGETDSANRWIHLIRNTQRRGDGRGCKCCLLDDLDPNDEEEETEELLGLLRLWPLLLQDRRSFSPSSLLVPTGHCSARGSSARSQQSHGL
jgi:hypothetical protein